MFLPGLQHEFCLITGQNVPQIPNMLQLDKLFADPRQELRATEGVRDEIFNVRYKGSDTCTGNYITGLPRKVLMSEMDYFWNRGHLKLKRAILWRTERGGRSFAGASDSALCLGNESAKKC